MIKFEWNSPTLKERRKELRKNQTEAEKLLWEKLRNQQLLNLKFHRQYSIGPYILDFYCPQIRLGIELDGNKHKQEKTKIYDQNRSDYLKIKEVQILRFWNSDIFNNLEGVLKKITEKIDLSLITPPNLPLV